MHRPDAFVQPVLMVLVLPLEVLRAQKQPLAPENLAGHRTFPPVFFADFVPASIRQP
jgi:hypothetical protein